jgi:hypothetical protein
MLKPMSLEDFCAILLFFDESTSELVHAKALSLSSFVGSLDVFVF